VTFKSQRMIELVGMIDGETWTLIVLLALKWFEQDLNIIIGLRSLAFICMGGVEIQMDEGSALDEFLDPHILLNELSSFLEDTLVDLLLWN
jgi:hypothetical protein